MSDESKNSSMKISVILNVLLAAGLIAGWLYCKNQMNKESHNLTEEQINTYIIKANEFDSVSIRDSLFMQQRDKIYDEVYQKYKDTTKNLITRRDGVPFEDYQIAKEYIKGFTDDTKAILNALTQEHRQPNAITTSVWVNAATINHFYNLCFGTDHLCDGVRLYFSKYIPKSVGVDNVRDRELGTSAQERGDIENKYTVILVATIPDGMVNGDVKHKNYYKQHGTTHMYDGLYDYNKPCPPKCNDVSSNDPLGDPVP